MKTRALLLFICSSFIFASCGDDDSGDVNLDPTLLATWEREVTAARELADNSTEGTLPGDFFVGSIAKLREGIDLAQGIADRATEDIRIESARLVLQSALDEFEVSLVEQAIPRFSGLSSEVITTNPDAELSPDEFTVELRVKLQSYDANSGVANLIGTENQTPGTFNTSGWTLRYLTSSNAPSSHGTLQVVIGSGNDGVYWSVVSTAAVPYVLPLDQWVRLALTYNNQNLKIYVDGVLLTEGVSQPINPDAALGFFRIGNSAFKDGRFTNGIITDVRFWDVERTAQEISDNMEDYLPGPFSNYPDLALYFPLNANLGENIDDVTGNYKATATGLTWVQE